MKFGFVAFAEADERHAEIEMGFGIFRLEPQRCAIVRKGFFGAAKFCEHVAEVVLRL